MTNLTEKSKSFTGWEEYPLNLPFSALDANSSWCNEELSRDAQRLFVPEDEDSELQFLEGEILSEKVGTGDHKQLTIRSSEQLLSRLEGPTKTLFFQIAQEHSWSQLLITEELFRKLLTVLSVHPGFLDVVHSFGEKITASEESFTAFFTRIFPQISSSPGCEYELAYNAKYVARHGRKSLKDPFSIRETGVYHKLQKGPDKCTWILLNPPQALSERLAKACFEPETSEPLEQFRWHALILLSLSESWRDYVNYLEESFASLMDRCFSSTLQPSVRDGTITVEFGDVRCLQIMTDKLKRLIHLLNLNRNLSGHLKNFFGRVKALSSPQIAGSFGQYEVMIENYVFQIETHISRLESIVSRAQGVGSMIEHILDIRTAETNHKINSAMHDISKQGAEENSLVRRLTSQSTKDTRAMRSIALISAIFLPATFLATFFGSNFFGFETTGDGYSLKVASNIWIYALTAVILSAIAVTVWYCCCSRNRPRPTRAKGIDSVV